MRRARVTSLRKRLYASLSLSEKGAFVSRSKLNPLNPGCSAAIESREAAVSFACANMYAAEEIESKMSSITALLSSFAALVQEQSETVREIGELAGQARGEVEKGGDELVTAKKRMDGSQMWIPMFNLFMAFLLLFMHWINP